MKLTILLALLCCANAVAGETEDLADRPEAYVQDGVCNIVGAVWDGGPVRNAKLQLLEVDGSGVYETQTDNQGRYQVSIPVSTSTALRAVVFKESMPRDSSSLHGRWSRWSSPRVMCRKVSVDIGPIEALR
jgi:hypothetical protein